jgi:DNA-binding transcriptional MerR regulator
VTGWTTREAAEKCGLTQHTLRWYERIGLLDRVARTADGRRRFSDADLDWLLLLSKLRATGMPVRDMLRYAGLVRSGAGQQERRELLERHRDRVRQALLEQQECLKLLDYKIAAYCDRVPAAAPPPGAATTAAVVTPVPAPGAATTGATPAVVTPAPAPGAATTAPAPAVATTPAAPAVATTPAS